MPRMEDNEVDLLNQLSKQELVRQILDLRYFRSMETAPKDGTKILAWCDGSRDHFERPSQWCVIAWESDDPRSDPLGRSWCGTVSWWHKPTHWMPLPEPPAAPNVEA